MDRIGISDRTAIALTGDRSPAPAPLTEATAVTEGGDGGKAPPGGKELPQQVAAAAPVGLDQAVQRLNGFVQNYQRQLSFSVHEETGITVVKVIDTATEEVIRQIPPEEVLAVAEQIQMMFEEQRQLPEGILVREKA